MWSGRSIFRIYSFLSHFFALITKSCRIAPTRFAMSNDSLLVYYTMYDNLLKRFEGCYFKYPP